MLRCSECSRKSRELTFAVDKGAEPTLAKLKAGERAKVGYVGAGGHLTAKTIARMGHMARK
ncbi:MAG: hypothetical protein HYY95_16065 [Candidatus Rokubacteria bacterium]|nr:hypothetical protein [Candidatus Rokubacteria bacterium]MBI3107056.1 hypothetical protein [Candidatus Rokubacteria bacterium]